MATDFKSKLKKDPKKVTTEQDLVTQKKSTTQKKKVGRPKIKTEECKTINIAVPISLLEQINVAKLMYKDNLTLYINKLIEKDIEANYDRYKTFAEMQAEALK